MTKQQIKALWKLCFDDSDAFIDMYFRLRYNDEVNIAIESGKEVVSALQMIPYPMTFCGEQIQTSYISGACTHPDFRGNGIMRELLSQAFARMRYNRVVLSTLIPAEPWLFDYYARMGYMPVFRYSEKKISQWDISPVPDIFITKLADADEEVYQYLDKKKSERTCCIQNTFSDFKVIFADLLISKGTFYIATVQEQIAGIAVVYPNGNGLQINELLTENSEIEKALLYHIRQEAGTDAITMITPPMAAEEQYPLGMARIIDARTILQFHAALHPEIEMNIKLTDEQLAINNGYYYLYKGKCKFSKERLLGSHRQLTIGELCEKLLSPLQPYMSLMLN